MTDFVKVTTLDTLREGKGRAFTVEGRELALFLIAGVVYAIENLCPHQHIPVLAEGELCDTLLTCPMHGWRFDLATGRAVDASGRVTAYDVRIEGKDVLIALPDQETQQWW
ncbi:MAG: nitrite reductase (NAD(P)H) small subunit [Bacteroidetes bacterium]|nr:nitrite reductase (NAD(P)H) small subunit [Bacteroidota bacterium]